MTSDADDTWTNVEICITPIIKEILGELGSIVIVMMAITWWNEEVKESSRKEKNIVLH